jgi:hypothetical protein
MEKITKYSDTLIHYFCWGSGERTLDAGNDRCGGLYKTICSGSTEIERLIAENDTPWTIYRGFTVSETKQKCLLKVRWCETTRTPVRTPND